MPRLDNWKLIYSLHNVITNVPSMAFLEGNVFDDERFQDGTWIRTSAVIELEQGRAKTMNTTYILE